MKKNHYLLLLFFLCMLSSFLIIPFTLNLLGKTLHDITLISIVMLIVQNTIFYSVCLLLGYRWSQQLDIHLVLLENKTPAYRYIASNMKYILGYGLCSFAFIFCADRILFQPNFNATISTFHGLLASFYGGINEEVINRFFLMSGLAVLCTKIFNNKSIAIWISIVITSIGFGLLHLPVTAAITPLTRLLITRAILLNGVPSIIFGWLYWKKSLEVAMITHFFVDICLYVIAPIVTKF